MSHFFQFGSTGGPDVFGESRRRPVIREESTASAKGKFEGVCLKACMVFAKLSPVFEDFQ